MSLVGALNSAKTALAVQQAAIQVTGNNIANAGNADYTRQVSRISPNADQQIRPGVFIGTGVNLDTIQRQIDDALEGRLRGTISDNEGAATTELWMGRVESLLNEMSDSDLSTQFSKFFNSWSNLANKPQDIGLRQVVLQNGQSLAASIRSLRSGLGDLQTDVDQRMKSLADTANGLAQQAADLNVKIAQAEGGGRGQANGLRDQRDAVLKQLSTLIDVKTVDTGDGMVNVLVGSEPLVMGSENRGIALKQDSSSGTLVTRVVFRSDGGTMNLSSGQLGALSGVRAQMDDLITQTDSLANNFIFELNKIHSSGQGLEGFSSIQAQRTVDDPAAALNDPASGLPFALHSGSFVAHVREKSTGLVTSTLVRVDLDGKGGNDTTLNDLQGELDGIDGISASISAGRLRLAAENSDIEISFSQDSSGALSALGINSFFTGKDARDIDVSAELVANPALLAAAKNGEKGDNQTARAIAAIEAQGLAGLNNQSLKDRYQAMVNQIATTSQSAKTNAEAAKTVKETLEAQREALSGVSMDEEAINLVRQQRAFQGAARLIAAVDEMMKTILQMV